jgi:pimeloyl-ACP methyl ester carboxylesterase
MTTPQQNQRLSDIAVKPTFGVTDCVSIRFVDSDPANTDALVLTLDCTDGSVEVRSSSARSARSSAMRSATPLARTTWLRTKAIDSQSRSVTSSPYPTELEVLRDVLPHIQTPVQIVAGRRDTVVPPVNAEYLHERLPHSELHLLDSRHFVWEDAADEYAALMNAWADGYKTCGKSTRRMVQ